MPATAKVAANTLISRVRLEHFRSIPTCDVALGPLTFVVGRNASGKSNFLDALHFIADALRDNLDFALERRGGIGEIRLRSRTRPFDVTIQLDLALPEERRAEYRVVISSQENEVFVKSESCSVELGPGDKASYSISQGVVTGIENAPPAAKDRLYLVTASGLPAFRPAFDALSGMRFYNLVPMRMREPIEVDRRSELAPDGANIGAVLGNLEKRDPATVRSIEQYLEKILPGLTHLERYLVGSRETIEFEQNGWTFEALQMSDGTLRALGILAAVLRGSEAHPRLVGVEEPETALHPAAFGVLRDALREAAEKRQIIVTSQSPELLDDPDLQPHEILAATLLNGLTKLGPIEQSSLSVLQSHLLTAGELLRQDKLHPA